MEKVTEEFKNKVDRIISNSGMKKSYVAKQMGLDAVRFSQTMAGVRKIQPDELKKLNQCLGLSK